MKGGSVPTIQPPQPKALPEAPKRTMDNEEKEIPVTASQTPGKRSQTSRAVYKLSVSRVSQSKILRRIFFIRSVLTVPPSSSMFYFSSQLLANNKRTPVAANTITSASESMSIDTETSACSEDVTSPRFKEVAVQCDILHETSIGKGRLHLDIILPRFFLAR